MKSIQIRPAIFSETPGKFRKCWIGQIQKQKKATSEAGLLFNFNNINQKQTKENDSCSCFTNLITIFSYF